MSSVDGSELVRSSKISSFSRKGMSRIEGGQVRSSSLIASCALRYFRQSKILWIGSSVSPTHASHSSSSRLPILSRWQANSPCPVSTWVLLKLTLGSCSQSVVTLGKNSNVVRPFTDSFHLSCHTSSALMLIYAAACATESNISGVIS
jgi:hypothetical protein